MSRSDLTIRMYGSAGPWVIVLHGGPGAPGYMAPVARALADGFRVLEPFQRTAGAEPLTVARHVADLREIVVSRCGGARPALVGHSWGAMLALAFASAHPDLSGPIALVGCGTFDLAARAHYRATVDARIGSEAMAHLTAATDPDERLRLMAEIYPKADQFDALPEENPSDEGPFDARGHEETWSDMMRCQAEGLYPAAFSRVRGPVIMLQGAYDPHPGAMIRELLARVMPQVEYKEWERCGHYPWRERACREDFLAVLKAWLSEHAGAAQSAFGGAGGTGR